MPLLVAAVIGSFAVPFFWSLEGSWRLSDLLNSAVIAVILTPFIFAIVLIFYLAIAAVVLPTTRWIRRSLRNDS